MEPKSDYCIHKNLPLVLILSQEALMMAQRQTENKRTSDEEWWYYSVIDAVNNTTSNGQIEFQEIILLKTKINLQVME